MRFSHFSLVPVACLCAGVPSCWNIKKSSLDNPCMSSRGLWARTLSRQYALFTLTPKFLVFLIFDFYILYFTYIYGLCNVLSVYCRRLIGNVLVTVTVTVYSLYLILVQLTLLSLVVYGSTVSAPCCLVVLFHSKCFYVLLSYFTALCEWNKESDDDDDDDD